MEANYGDNSDEVTSSNSGSEFSGNTVTVDDNNNAA
jgi:hypothetical protein